MESRVRHMFPGNNTPEGFFSYYKYILGQKEADKIFCIKGGPGVGKSTFMKKIGDEFLKEGLSVDFMHCSSDSESLDGIVIREKKIALIDATSPHVVDPIHPGAVDTILHLGEYWDEDGIRKNKVAVMACQERLTALFSTSYSYLGAAGKIYENLERIYTNAIKKEELYKIAAEIISRELIHKELSPNLGAVKKYFASAITPEGAINHLSSLAEGYKKIYVFTVPVGVSVEKILELFAESALYRGYNIEGCYCTIRPKEKLEHLFVPDLSVAFITSNDFHKLDVNKIEGNEDIKIINVDLEKLILPERIRRQKEVLDDSTTKFVELLDKAVWCLKQARSQHDLLEEHYIPNMDFSGIDLLTEKVIEDIRKR